LEPIDGEKKTGGRLGLLIVIVTLAHGVLYAPSLYLPFDLDELFFLGYALVLVDSSLVVFLGIKLCILPGNG
jgi:hypothetical protein